MKAVNLIPADSRRGGGGGRSALPSGPAYLVLGGLLLALIFVVVLVLTNNSISDKQAKLSSLRAEVSQEQALAARLGAYQRFEQLAQARAQTVRQILTSRFDWHGTLSDLSKVVPANTSLQSLAATVSTGSSAGGASGAGSNIRGAINAPAFQLTGCTKTQDDVARLMSRLRAMDGVTRVTLQSSAKPGSGAGGSSAASTPSVSSAGGGCGTGPTFSLVVFFQPLSSGVAGATGGTGQPASVTTSPGSSR